MKKRLTVLALAFAMVLTMSASVFAVQEATPTAPASAKLVKYLKKAEGITNPTATYSFKFEPTGPETISVDKDKDNNTIDPAKVHDTVPVADFPAVTAIENTRTASDTNKAFNYMLASTAVATDAGITGTSDVKGSVSIETIFTGVSFPHAGEYLYTVTEMPIGNGANDTKFTKTETDTTSDELTVDAGNEGSSYTLHLYVTNEDKKNNDGEVIGTEPKITNVTVEDKDGKKVDPSDEDPTPHPDQDPTTPDDRTDADYHADGFTFTNSYEKTIKKHEDPDDPTDPDMLTNAFQVDKIVTGKYGDKTKKFDIFVTVQLPKGSSFGYASKITGQTDDVTFDNDGKATIKLADSENFGFSELPVGTKITVLEDDYTADYETQAWTTKTTATNDATNEGLGKTILVGEKGASAKVTNACKDDEVTPTGIIINNLPYVLLIGLALGGIVLFSRKRRYE